MDRNDPRFARMMQMRREIGPLINRAIPKYEDPTRYPIDQLVDLFHTQQKLMGCQDDAQRTALKAEFATKLDAIELLPDAPERIYLWPEGKMPTHTEYTDNSDYRYDHDPDFRPYFLEQLLPEGQTPIGAVVTIAGGTHGAGTMNECYQVGKELNALGFHAFILQCRPNGSPWDRYETGVDAARALRIIRSRAEQYHLRPNTIALAGFSNGGITCDFCIESYSGNQTVKAQFPDYIPDELDELPGGPDAYLCVYGARHAGTEFNYDGVVYPPTFFAIGRLDKCMDNFHALYPDLLSRGVPMEVHTFAGHPHGYAGWKIIDGVGNPNFDSWVNHAAVFLADAFKE